MEQSNQVIHRELTRRTLLQAAAGVATAVGLPLIAACAPSSPPPAPAATAALGAASSSSGAPAAGRPAAGTALLPTWIPTSNPNLKPDYHSSDPRVLDGYEHYPKNPFKSWTKEPPGTGSTVNVFVVAYFPPPTPQNQNPTWQEVNRQLNANLQMNLFPSADYRTKMGVLQAGSDLPDIMHIYQGLKGAPNLVEFIKARCADLTPYLAGDAIKDYPNLAAIPTYAWKNSSCVIDGKLYQWPLHRYLPGTNTNGGLLFRNNDIWNQVIGQGVEPRDAEDFKKMLQQLNRPQANQWAAGNVIAAPNPLGLVSYAAMFNAPNVWGRDANGRLVRDRETEQYKAAVGYVRDLWSAGLMWPNGTTAGTARTDFAAGRFAVSSDGFGNGWSDFWRQGLQQKPPNHMDLIPPFAATAGAKPTPYLTGGWLATNVMKKASPDRIRELLRIIDWLAAPFGSQEALLLSYGVEGRDYALDAFGDPQLTPVGNTNAGYVPWRYISQYPFVNYQADLPGFTKRSFEAEELIDSLGVEDVTNGTYSSTNFAAASTKAEQAFFDGLTDILLGRRPLGEYDALVRDWRTAAGDKIRAEFTEASAAA